MDYLAPALCGLVFGVAIEKGRVHEPQFIRGQMDFSYFVMLKMFLGAYASGMVGMCILSMSSHKHKLKLIDARTAFCACLKDKGFISSIVGGALLGCGMSLAGACPGMVLVQVGTRTHNALYTLTGGLLGTLLYALLEPTVVKLTKPSGITRHERLDSGRSYATTALPLASIVALFLIGLEFYWPWTSDVKSSRGGNLLTMRSWPPYIAGALIGALQVPLILFVGDTLSGSGGYCTILSQGLVTTRLRQALPYLAKYKDGRTNWWQVVYIGAAVVGGFFSALASDSLGQSSPVSRSDALVGGTLMLFGARLAGGCTSGHGLSGMSLLIVNSYVVVVSMFASAMLTYSAMKRGIF